MKEYTKPTIKEEQLVLEDIIAASFGGDQPGDVVDRSGFIW